MPRIARLTEASTADLRRLIDGYRSEQRYRVERTETDNHTEIHLILEDLVQPFIKHFGQDAELEDFYPKMIAQGYSWGAWADGMLVGIGLCEPRHWNNSLWLWELHIQNGLRGQGLGGRLIQAVQEQAQAGKFRQVALEVQNTNVPAIRFYRKHGFAIEGLDISQYTNTPAPDGEIALFMKWNNPLHT